MSLTEIILSEKQCSLIHYCLELLEYLAQQNCETWDCSIKVNPKKPIATSWIPHPELLNTF